MRKIETARFRFHRRSAVLLAPAGHARGSEANFRLSNLRAAGFSLAHFNRTQGAGIDYRALFAIKLPERARESDCAAGSFEVIMAVNFSDKQGGGGRDDIIP